MMKSSWQFIRHADVVQADWLGEIEVIQTYKSRHEEVKVWLPMSQGIFTSTNKWVHWCSWEPDEDSCIETQMDSWAHEYWEEWK